LGADEGKRPHAVIASLRRLFIYELSEDEVRMLTDVSVRVWRRLAEVPGNPPD
jgi:hypothetical protein